MKLGLWIFALSSIFAGVLDLVWREFEPAHQPVRALADPLPGEPILAAIGAAILILGGGALLIRRTQRAGAIGLGTMYLLFAFCWAFRYYTATKALGPQLKGVYSYLSLFLGITAMVFVELVLVMGAWLAYAWASDETAFARAINGSRWILGLGTLAFGLGHLTGTKNVATMMPSWFPLGGVFWVVVTGIAFLLAGIAILARIQDVLAARMLAVMFGMFSLVLLTPGIFAYPHNHVAWGGNACNLTVMGAVLLFSEALASRQNSKNATRALSNDVMARV